MPLENLGLALGQLRPDKALEIKETFVHEIRGSGPDTAIPLVRSCLHDDETNLLILVDQFEELFRYRVELDADKSAEEAELFVASLLALAKQQSVPAYVVIAMRSDFLGDCAAFPDLSDAINRSVFLVPRMRPLQVRKAIEAPLTLFGGSISSRLHERIAEDLRAYTADQLPVLQHALNRTWSRWQYEGRGEDHLDLPHYEAIGSMAHALDRHAEKAYRELVDERQKKICEKIFKALTDKGTDPRGIRRPTRLGVLCELAEASQAEVTQVIDVFRKPSRSFLMPPFPDALAKDTVIDISHESFMRVWERLTWWTDEEAKSARLFRRIFDTANLHADGKAGLWHDPDLQLGLEWWDKEEPTETWARLYGGDLSQAKNFLMESQDRRAAEVLATEERRKRELDQAQNLTEERQSLIADRGGSP